MKFFKEKQSGEVFGYDENDATQKPLIDACLADKKKWQDVSESWPPAPTQSELDAVAAAQAKADKVAALNSIVVTTASGKSFDGNEPARLNILSALTAAVFVGQTTAPWKMADNTVEMVTVDELKEALALAITRVGEIVTGQAVAQ